MVKDFFKFTPKHLEIAQTLNGNELKLWLYFSLLDPFGDRGVDIPSLEEIEEATGLKKNSYYLARAKLNELGVWSFIKKKTQGFNAFCRNLLNNKPFPEKQESVPENRESLPEKQESVPENRESSPGNRESVPENRENRELEPREDKGSSVSQTLQTPQTFLYSPDPNGEKQKEDKQETEQEGYGQEKNVSTKDKVENISSSSPVLNQETKVSTLDLSEDKNSCGCSINEETNNGGETKALSEAAPSAAAKVNAPVEKPVLRSKEQLTPVQQRNWQWLPDGAWKTPEGKLDPNFQEWFAKTFFMEELGNSNFFLAKANVLAYFKNDLDRLSFRWEQYHEEYLSKLENTSTLLEHGVKIKDDRRKETISRVRAVIPVASEQSVSTKPTDVNSNLQSLESIVNSVNPPQLNPAAEEIEAEVIEVETLNDPWSEESALTVIGRKDTNIEVKDTKNGVKNTQVKYTVIDNSDCPDPEVLSLVYRDVTGIAEQIEKEKREAVPPSPLAKAMTEDFLKLMAGKPIDRPLEERIEVINYALSHGGRNKYFFAQAQQFSNQGWKVDFNDEGEPAYIYPDSAPNETPNSNPKNDSPKNSPDPNRLIEIAKELNEVLKDKILRSSSYYINQVKEFLKLGLEDWWLADYDADGFPTEVYQF